VKGKKRAGQGGRRRKEKKRGKASGECGGLGGVKREAWGTRGGEGEGRERSEEMGEKGYENGWKREGRGRNLIL